MTSGVDSALVELDHVVRAVIASRVRDRHLVDDLTQETLRRVMSVRHQLNDSTLRAYAIGTARNTVAAHFRALAVSERHAHRLVDDLSVDGPEPLILASEETDAITAALGRLDPADRELLLRHESDDADLDTLAHEHTTSSGAIAMRLSRARAVLRLEFVLAFRRIQLPSARCRAVLLALSNGDHRRQADLHAGQHLLHCPTCNQLSRAVTERNRGIAAWLIFPAAELIRRAGTAIRRHRPVQVAAGILASAALGLLVINQDQADPPANAANPATATPSAAGEPQPIQTTSAPVTDRPESSTASPPTRNQLVPLTGRPTSIDTVVASSAPPTAARAESSTSPPCGPAQPLDGIDHTALTGCPFAPTTIIVVDVPLDEGFWATTPEQQTVLVQMVGTGESPLTIEPGMALTIAGVIAPPPANPAEIGLADNDPYIAQLDYHVEVRYQDIQTA